MTCFSFIVTVIVRQQFRVRFPVVKINTKRRDLVRVWGRPIELEGQGLCITRQHQLKVTAKNFLDIQKRTGCDDNLVGFWHNPTCIR